MAGFFDVQAGGRQRRGRHSSQPPAAAAGYRQLAGLLMPASGAAPTIIKVAFPMSLYTHRHSTALNGHSV